MERNACGADAGDWWGPAMDAAYAGGFKDLETVAPCGKTVSMNELRYVSPTAFGRFALGVRNPETVDTTEKQDRAVWGCWCGRFGRIIRAFATSCGR